MEGIEFETDKYSRSSSSYPKAPKMVAFIIKYSRGYVVNKEQAIAILLVASVIVILFSVYNASHDSHALPAQVNHPNGKILKK